MKRINSARELRELAEELGVRPDWHEPDEQDLTVRFEGETFDNAGHWPAAEVAFSLDWTGELCVILSQGERDVAVVNLASLLAMASYPDGPLR